MSTFFKEEKGGREGTGAVVLPVWVFSAEGGASFLCQPQHTFRMEKPWPRTAPLTVDETLLAK